MFQDYLITAVLWGKKTPNKLPQLFRLQDVISFLKLTTIEYLWQDE